MKKYLTMEDLKQILGISRTTAYQLVHQIRHTKIGRRILIAEEDLNDFIQSKTEFGASSNSTDADRK